MNRTLTFGAMLLASAPFVATLTADAQSATGKAAAETITVTGCVQRESDYRKANDKGRGGVAGTGVGQENEFVLVAATPGRGTPSATSTGAGAQTAYELSGENEKLAAGHINHRVEITGVLKSAAVSGSGATGGTTAGTPPTGVDVLSKDLRLRELEVTSLKMISADCSK